MLCLLFYGAYYVVCNTYGLLNAQPPKVHMPLNTHTPQEIGLYYKVLFLNSPLIHSSVNKQPP